MNNQECIDILQQMANKEKNNETPEFRALIHAIRLCKMMECKDLADTCRDCGGCFVDWNWRNTSHRKVML